MRHVMAWVGLSLALLPMGCRLIKPNGGSVNPPPPRYPMEKPTTESLVGYLNRNAERLQTLECPSLDIDAKQQGSLAIGLRGSMACQKPRNFRLEARALGQKQVDIGSNSQEFWYWIAKADPPYLVHCSYDDLARGAPMPFPFQPEWVMEALGMTERNPQGNYQINETADSWQLVEQTTSPQGRPVRKVTSFRKAYAANGSPQVAAHGLLDEQGKTVCFARIEREQVDQGSGAVVPQKISLHWPAAQLSLTITLEEYRINTTIPGDRLALLFGRPQMANVPTYDLGRGRPSMPTGRIERAGAFQPAIGRRR